MFRVHVKDVHCKHVFLGGSSDNGYARVLEPYAGDEVIKNRITMLEGPPFAAELSALVGKFRVTSFSEVFRSKKLGSASHSSLAGTPQLPGSTYAKTASSGTTVELEMAQKNPLGALKLPTGGILRNKQGQRVDKPIPPVSDNLFCLMRDAKLCNYYHLGSHCPLKRCEYIHEPRLYGEHLNARRLVARLSPCKLKDLDCADKNCFYGHRCPDDPNCTRSKCRFPAKMHNVDTNVVD